MQVVRYAAQALVYGLFALGIGVLSQWPDYTRVEPDKALIRLSFAHGAARKGECRRRSREELMKLAPNMRKPLDCPRERLPVVVELDLNGEPVFAASLAPTGLSGDGASNVYERFVVPAGRHRIDLRLRDTARTAGFDHTRTVDVDLVPGRALAIDFKAANGGFIIE